MAYAVFGDSFVTRLEMHFSSNLGFQFPVRFYGVPGMSTRRKFQEKFDELVESRPRYVFIILGGNDITATSSPGDVFSNLRNVVEEMKDCGVERVFLSTITPRSSFRDKRLTEKAFMNQMKGINERIRKKLPKEYVDTGKLLKFPQHFSADGVHPNREKGMLKLRRTIVTQFAKTIPKSVVVKRQ